jgi:hypothetical protein
MRLFDLFAASLIAQGEAVDLCQESCLASLPVFTGNFRRGASASLCHRVTVRLPVGQQTAIHDRAILLVCFLIFPWNGITVLASFSFGIVSLV